VIKARLPRTTANATLFFFDIASLRDALYSAHIRLKASSIDCVL